MSNSERQGADGRAWPSLGEAMGVWARIAALSFGGPAGQIAVMHRILVEEKRWLGEKRFLHALNFCMLLPGPEAQQLTVYIGWLMHRTWGGIIAGTLFVLPGALAILGLSWIYAVHGEIGFVQGIFDGLKAAVVAIVVAAVLRIGQKALGNRAMWALAAASFLAIFVFGIPFPVIVLAAGIIGFVAGRSGSSAFQGGGHGNGGDGGIEDAETILGDGINDPTSRPSLLVCSVLLLLWLGPIAGLVLVLGPDHVFSEIAVFFSKMAVVTFGGAYAVLAYVAQAAVDTHGWLRPGEMLDGLGLAETTPGPLIMVTQFVGSLAAYRDPGSITPTSALMFGAAITTWVTFAPCFLWILAGAPYVERLRGNKAISGALAAITAAVVGVILNLAVWFAIHVVFADVYDVSLGPIALSVPDITSVDVVAAILCGLFAWLALQQKWGAIRLVLVGAGLGLLIHLAAVAFA